MIQIITSYKEIEPFFELSWETWLSKDSTNRRTKSKLFILERLYNKTILGYYVENKLAGYLMYSNFWDAVHIDDIFVSEKHRKQGIAIALINHLKRLSNIIYSDCDTNNAASINLHKKTDFMDLGVLDNWFDKTPSIFFKYERKENANN